MISVQVDQDQQKSIERKQLYIQSLLDERFPNGLNNQIKENIAGKVQCYYESKKRLNSLKTLFVQIKELFTEQILKIISMIAQEIAKLAINMKDKMDKIMKIAQSIESTQVEQILKSFLNEGYSDQTSFDNDLLIKMAREQFHQLIKQLESFIQTDFLVKKSALNIQENNNREFKLQSETTQVNKCYAIAMNKAESILVSGELSDITIWDFSAGVLIKKQTLKGHRKYIYCLCYSKMSNWFISGSWDKTIRIWKEQQNCRWDEFQVLQAHSQWIIDIILNNEEDQFISSSVDKTIKHLLGMQLNFNPSLSSTSINKKWKMKQIVDNPEKDTYLRVSFIEENELIATTNKNGRFYRILSTNIDQFKIDQEIILNEYEEQNNFVFPIAYNKLEGIAVCRQNNEAISILVQQADKNFSTLQTEIIKQDIFHKMGNIQYYRKIHSIKLSFGL